MQKILDRLSDRCVETHTAADIIRHLGEEMSELADALDRYDRGKEPFEHVLEELTDVRIETVTVIKLFKSLGLVTELSERGMYARKLAKFEQMLIDEQALVDKGELTFPINRYDKGFARFNKG